MTFDSISLPEIEFNRAGMVYMNWSDVGAMDMVREVISNIDLNPPWAPRYTEDDYYANIAHKASMGLHYINPVRNTYSTGTNRTYSMAKVSPEVVASIVQWLENGFGIRLYHSMSTRNLSIRVENTPRCPGCGSRLQLFWKIWNTAGSRPRSSNYNLQWGCPHYGDKCSKEMERLWSRKLPQLVVDKILPTYFHDWELDGYPIPGKYMMEPLSQWSIALTQEATMNRRGVEFTDSQLEHLKENYADTGVAGFLRKFNNFHCSWNSVQRAASKLGVTRAYNGKARRKNREK